MEQPSFSTACEAKRSIALHYGLDTSFVESWLFSLSFVRNECAHGGVLYGRELEIHPRAHKLFPQVSNRHAFYQVLVLSWLLERDIPNSSQTLIDDFAKLLSCGSLRGKTIQISYKAKLRSGAKLDPYLNAEGNVASVPYQAHTSFDGESKVVSSQVENVKFRVSAATGNSTRTAKSSLAKTGDAMSYAVPAALAELAAAMLALAARRRMRD